jgi:hypothetical protein
MDNNNMAIGNKYTNNDNDNRIPDNPPAKKMTPGGNHLSKIKNGLMTESEVFPKMLEWCCRASQLEHCPIFTGTSKYRNEGLNCCTCLHALQPKVDGEDSPALP